MILIPILLQVFFVTVVIAPYWTEWNKWQVMGRNYTGKQQVACKSNSLIYILSCSKCGKQYIGETKRTLGEKMSEQFIVIHNTKPLLMLPPSWLLKDPTPVGRQWGQASHSVDDIKINILAFIQQDPEDPQTALCRVHIEYQWIYNLEQWRPLELM